MIEDPRTRFSATAELYQRYRPSYPTELVDRLVAITGVTPPARVVDLGCGTGISSRLFASRGFEVTGVDPNEDMLAFARASGSARYVVGEATKTGLDAASFDLAIAAQAFHWFDVDAALAEIARIVRKKGWATAFWNEREETPFLVAYEEALRAWSGEYEQIPRFRARRREIAERVAGAVLFELPNEQRLDREGLRGRAWSSSYVAHGVKDREGFDRALDALFDRYAAGDVVTFAYEVIGVAWPMPERR